MCGCETRMQWSKCETLTVEVWGGCCPKNSDSSETDVVIRAVALSLKGGFVVWQLYFHWRCPSHEMRDFALRDVAY
ncbi:hypothetical protein CDL15_Pgr021953 [Punica granatum]|uniref:Uncharacterized protein n=1 Tax=Punica granatum TaxID=22663 RepID=A0A218WDK4_PUNGR|nr:hypothetical protein CDL15_Pgr021953 [Punica granatum]